MVYSNLKSPEVENLDKSKILVLIPVGSIEAHGSHLPIGTDSIVIKHFSEELEKSYSNKILLAPMIEYSYNLINYDYSGTISIDIENYAHSLQNIITSFYHHGFENFFIFSSHGGNEIPVKLAINNLLCDFRDLENYPKIAFKTWWDLAKLKSRHAENLETELMMIISPNFVDLSKAVDCKPENTWHYFPSRKIFYPETYGVNGEPSKANLESAKLVYEKVWKSLVNYVEKIL